MNIVTIYLWIAGIMLPLLLLCWLIMSIEKIKYKYYKFKYGSKGFRFIYTGENGKVSSEYVKIGTEYSDQVVEYDEKTFLFDNEELMTLPKSFGRFKNESFLWYRWDNVCSLALKSEKSIKVLQPVNPKQFIKMKLPKEFYDALNTKAVHDLFTGDKDALSGKQIAYGMIFLIVISAIGYLAAKKMGYL